MGTELIWTTRNGSVVTPAAPLIVVITEVCRSKKVVHTFYLSTIGIENPNAEIAIVSRTENGTVIELANGESYRGILNIWPLRCGTPRKEHTSFKFTRLDDLFCETP